MQCLQGTPFVDLSNYNVPSNLDCFHFPFKSNHLHMFRSILKLNRNQPKEGKQQTN